jgi:hypothetical protein
LGAVHSAAAPNLTLSVYAWFTEGFGTPDLREAKALLEALHALADYALGPHNLMAL